MATTAAAPAKPETKLPAPASSTPTPSPTAAAADATKGKAHKDKPSDNKENNNGDSAAGVVPAKDKAAASGDAAVPAGPDSVLPDPNDFSIIHPLQNQWTMYYDNNDKKAAQHNYESHLQSIYQFAAVEDFWRLFNNVIPPSKLTQGSDYAVFKDSIKPMWEDPINAKGGKWVVQIPHKQRSTIDGLWLHALLSLVGEQYEYADDICGCVISVRQRHDKVAIWTKSATNETIQKSIGREFKKYLNLPAANMISYSIHNDSLRRNSSFNVKNVYQV